MYNEDTVRRLTELVYDAALDPASWETFLEALGATLDAQFVNIVALDPQRPSGSIVCNARFDPSAMKEYTEHYYALDPWNEAAQVRGLWRPGVVGVGEAVLPEAEYRKTAFWNEYGRRYGFNGGLSAVIALNGNRMVVISASMLPGREPFGEREVDLVRALMPHLDRAVRIHRRLAASELERHASVEVLDRLRIGVILLGAGGGVVAKNRTADAVLGSRDGLWLDGDTLRAASAAETKRLATVIAEALDVRPRQAHTRGTMTISRPSLKRPFEVLVTPLRLPISDPFGASATAAVFVSDPETLPETDDAQLQSLFGLTPAESRLAGLLLRDRSVEEAADELGVSVHTARTHLKRVFAKTDTRRQGELLRRLATGLRQVRGDD